MHPKELIIALSDSKRRQKIREAVDAKRPVWTSGYVCLWPDAEVIAALEWVEETLAKD